MSLPPSPEKQQQRAEKFFNKKLFFEILLKFLIKKRGTFKEK
jgi:hypothetical protein